jgi:hypothetical protein
MGGAAPVPMADTEKTFPELYERIEKTIKVLETLKADSMDGKTDLEITMGERKMKGEDYIIKYAVPSKLMSFHFICGYLFG